MATSNKQNAKAAGVEDEKTPAPAKAPEEPKAPETPAAEDQKDADTSDQNDDNKVEEQDVSSDEPAKPRSARITAARDSFTGEIDGVRFEDGVAETDNYSVITYAQGASGYSVEFTDN